MAYGPLTLPRGSFHLPTLPKRRVSAPQPPDLIDRWMRSHTGNASPPAPTTGGTGSAPAATGGTDPRYDPNTDPDIAAIRAAGARSVNQAENLALRDRRTLLSRLGDSALARTVLGAKDPTLGAISDSPDSLSTLGQLQRAYLGDRTTSENQDNTGNLFYSSTRGTHLKGIEQDRLAARTQAEQDAQDQLQTIADTLLQTRQDAADSIAAAVRQWAKDHPLPPGGPAPATPGGKKGNLTTDGLTPEQIRNLIISGQL